jgi:hypothetical protein
LPAVLQQLIQYACGVGDSIGQFWSVVNEIWDLNGLQAGVWSAAIRHCKGHFSEPLSCNWKKNFEHVWDLYDSFHEPSNREQKTEILSPTDSVPGDAHSKNENADKSWMISGKVDEQRWLLRIEEWSNLPT